MISGEHIVFVVDDDNSVREALLELLESAGLAVSAFSCAAQYLESPCPAVPACLILDIELPDINGLALQQRLAHIGPPIIFLTGHGDIPSSVKAMKAGAIDFLTKPFGAVELLAAIQTALDRDRSERRSRADLAILRSRFSSLTPRERDVLPLIASGLLNKQAAAKLRISDSTLQIHRCSIMKKMAATSLAELVRMAARLAVPMTHSRCGPARTSKPALPTEHGTDAR